MALDELAARFDRVTHEHREDLVGTLCPQARIGGGLLDDLLGPGWSLLTDGAVPPDLRARSERAGARIVPVGDSSLRGWLLAGRAGAALLRPDRVVAATAPR